MVAAVGGWTVGFVGMWTSKWVFAWLFVDRRQVTDTVREQIQFRTGGESAGVTGTRLDGVIANVTLWWDRPLTPFVVIATLGVVAAFAWRYYRACRDWRDLAWLGVCVAIISVPVAVWYVFANNTVQVHASFMYRSVPIAFGAIAALIVAACFAEPTLMRPHTRDEKASDERVEPVVRPMGV
jgi:hypothetical protein